jgi:hypothetical protein
MKSVLLLYRLEWATTKTFRSEFRRHGEVFFNVAAETANDHGVTRVAQFQGHTIYEHRHK